MLWEVLKDMKRVARKLICHGVAAAASAALLVASLKTLCVIAGVAA